MPRRQDEGSLARVDEELARIMSRKRDEAAARENAEADGRHLADTAAKEVDRAIDTLLARAAELGVTSKWATGRIGPTRGWLIVRSSFDLWYITDTREWHCFIEGERLPDQDLGIRDHPLRELGFDHQCLQKCRDSALNAVASYLVSLEKGAENGTIAAFRKREAAVAAADREVRAFAAQRGATILSAEDGRWTLVKNRRLRGGHERWQIMLPKSGPLSIPDPEIVARAYRGRDR